MRAKFTKFHQIYLQFYEIEYFKGIFTCRWWIHFLNCFELVKKLPWLQNQDRYFENAMQ